MGASGGENSFKDKEMHKLANDDFEEETTGTEEKRIIPAGMVLASLDQDIYSLLMVSNYCSAEMWFCLCIAGIQMAVAILALESQLNLGKENFVNIPAGVDIVVSVGQFFLVIFIVANYGNIDLAQVVEDLTNGYDPEVKKKHPNLTKIKWLFANILHLLVGILLQLATFHKIMAQDKLLKLATVIISFGFIARIDNIAYKVAGYGVCSKHIQDNIARTSEVQMLKGIYYNFIRRATETLITIFFLIYYAILVINQINSRYVCTQIQIQFGDTYNAELSLHSGLFRRIQGNHLDRRSIYEDREGHYRFGYCAKNSHWSFYHREDPNNAFNLETEKEAACDQWIVKSPKNNGFDIIKTDSSNWIVHIKYQQGMTELTTQVDMFNLKCNECAGKCVKNNGKCNDHLDCICEEGFYGINCQMKYPCDLLQLDLRSVEFPKVLTETNVASIDRTAQFQLVSFKNKDKSIGIMYRPVYIYKQKLLEIGVNATDTMNYILHFTGRRWIISSLLDNKSKGDRISPFYDRKDFDPIFISSPMDVDTDTNQLTPVTLKWYETKRKPNSDVIESYIPIDFATGSLLTCSFCDDDFYPCLNNGVCVARSSTTEDKNKDMCQCTTYNGAGVGSRCEFVPDCDSQVYEAECYHGGTCNDETGRCDNCQSDEDNFYYGKLCKSGGPRNATRKL